MSPLSHVIASTITSGVFYSATQSVSGTVVCFLSGILIDIDHHFDLWMYKKKIILNYQALSDFCEKEKGGKIHLIFHSYELFALIWFTVLVYKPGAVWWGLGVGMTVHIILDEIYNPLRPLSYFFIYRLKHNFEKKALCTEKKYGRLV